MLAALTGAKSVGCEGGVRKRSHVSEIELEEGFSLELGSANGANLQQKESSVWIRMYGGTIHFSLSEEWVCRDLIRSRKIMLGKATRRAADTRGHHIPVQDVCAQPCCHSCLVWDTILTAAN